jgi:hypothetical protein
MEISLRTDNNLLFATLTDAMAEIFLARMIKYTREVKAKDPKKKMYIMTDNLVFRLSSGLILSLFKGYQIIVK